MVAKDDMELLQEYAASHSEQAFATLVERYVDMVYSAAVRCVGNHHQAEEVTQAVFLILAKKARSLRRGTILAGWLFQTARLTAANFRRTETRRVRREQEACMQSNLDEKGTDVWQQIAPLLDQAIAELGEKDRNAIVLRFVKGKDYKEVGAALGASEGAAQVRVSRAVERLREIFSKRGVVLSSAGLCAAMAVNSVQAAPAGLAAAVTAAAVKGTVVSASTLTLAKGTLKLMAWTKIKIAAGVGVAALVAYQVYHSASQDRQLTSAQNELQQAKKQLAARQATINRLEEEKQAVVEEKRNSELSAAKTLTRRQAALASALRAAQGKSAPSATQTGPPPAGIVQMMKDPAMKEYIHQKQLKTAREHYAPLFRELNLTPEQKEAFTQMIGDLMLRNSDIVSAVPAGNASKTEVTQALEESTREFKSKARALVGDSAYERFEEFTQEIPARLAVNQLNDTLGSNALSDEQGAQLIEIIKSEPYKLTHGMAGHLDPAFLGSQEEIDDHLQKVAESYQRILQQAGNFLAPEQLMALGMLQTNSINAQKLQGAALVQKH